MSRVLFILWLIGLSQFSWAQTNNISQHLIRALSSCDSRFFKTVGLRRIALAHTNGFVSNRSFASWRVEDSETPGKDVVIFDSPVKGDPLILGYFDEREHAYATSDVKVSTWGLLVKGNPSALVNLIQPLLKDENKFSAFDASYLKVESLTPNQKWMRIDAPSSFLELLDQKDDALQRIFFIDSLGTKPSGISKIGCRLQGKGSVFFNTQFSYIRPDVIPKKILLVGSKPRHSTPTFGVGDVVEPYQEYSHSEKKLIEPSSEKFRDTKWKVLAITNEYVQLEFLSGDLEYLWKTEFLAKGKYSTGFFSSQGYLRNYSGSSNTDQVFDEFRKIKSRLH